MATVKTFLSVQMKSIMSLRRVSIVLLISVVLAVLITACVSPAPAPAAPAVNSTASPQPPALTTVRVAYTPTTSFGPIYIAMDEGYFSRQGIQIELVKTVSSAASLPLLLSGDIAVASGPLKIGFINVIAKDEPVRIVADKGRISPSCTVYALMVRRDLSDSGNVTRVSDLRGRKIAARDSDYDLYRVLALGNLTKNDVDTVDMDFPTTITAFRNGAIDAGLVTEPYITQAVENGTAVVLVPSQQFVPDFPVPLYYGSALLEKNPELGRKFMIAYLQGVRQYNEGKTPRNLDIIANYTGLNRELLNRTCWYTIATDGRISTQPEREYLDWMHANNMTDQTLNDSQLYDMSYVDYANGVLQNSTGTE